MAVIVAAAGLLVGQSGGAYSAAEFKAIATFLTKGTAYFTKALPDAEIFDLAAIAKKPGGTKQVGELLGKRNLPNAVLEDTFARILVAQRRVDRVEADQWMRHLSEVPGFRSALSKSMGASAIKTSGHFTEIRIADNAAQMNFEVKGIGVPFKDPYKKGTTDIDVLLEKNGQAIAIEAKNYQPGTAVPLINFRADMQSLATYRDSAPNGNVLPVFWVTARPANPGDWKLLQAAADNFRVKLVDGSPSVGIHRVSRLVQDSQ